LENIVIIFYHFWKISLKNMKVRHESIKKSGLISWMNFFEETKNLRNILGGLKSNINIFRGSFSYLTLKTI